jgi:hypothetical protein
MRKNYVSPRVEVIEIEKQGVLCGSAPQPIINPMGGTENFSRNSFGL